MKAYIRKHNFESLLARRNISIKEFSRNIEMHQTHLSRLINGERCPSGKTREKIMMALGIKDFDYLFRIEEDGEEINKIEREEPMQTEYDEDFEMMKRREEIEKAKKDSFTFLNIGIRRAKNGYIINPHGTEAVTMDKIFIANTIDETLSIVKKIMTEEK